MLSDDSASDAGRGGETFGPVPPSEREPERGDSLSGGPQDVSAVSCDNAFTPRDTQEPEPQESGDPGPGDAGCDEPEPVDAPGPFDADWFEACSFDPTDDPVVWDAICATAPEPDGCGLESAVWVRLASSARAVELGRGMFDEVEDHLFTVRNTTQGSKVGLLEALRRIKAWTAAVEAEVLNDLLDDQMRTTKGFTSPLTVTANLTATELGVSLYEMEKRICTAQVAANFPEVKELWETGVLDTPKIDALLTRGTETARVHRLAVARMLETGKDNLRHAQVLTAREIKTQMRRLVAELDPVGFAARHREAVKNRCVLIRNRDDAMADILVYLPAVDAALMWANIETTTDALLAADPHKLNGKGRRKYTRNHARTDAMLALVTGKLGLTPTSAGQVEGSQPASAGGTAFNPATNSAPTGGPAFPGQADPTGSREPATNTNMTATLARPVPVPVFHSTPRDSDELEPVHAPEPGMGDWYLPPPPDVPGARWRKTRSLKNNKRDLTPCGGHAEPG